MSLSITVHQVSRFEFEVKDSWNVEIVNIREKKCSCRYIQIQQLPCPHTLAACRHLCLPHNALCSHYYTTNAQVAVYAEPIHLVGNDIEWVVPYAVHNIDVKPYRQRPSVSHPRKPQILFRGKYVVSRRCA